MERPKILMAVFSIPIAVAATFAAWLSVRMDSIYGILKAMSIVCAGISVVLALMSLDRSTPRYLRVLTLALAFLACVAAYGIKL